MDKTMAIIECLQSLDKVIIETHGTPLTTYRLKDMTALDLIMLIAPNGIRFTYDETLVVK